MSRKFIVASIVAISMIAMALAQSAPLYANLVIRVGYDDGKPVAGARVILHRSDGSVRKSMMTSSKGLADLGPVSAVRGTLTLAYDGTIITLAKIPFSSTVMKFNLFYREAPDPAPVAQIHVSMPPLSQGYLVPIDDWVSETDTINVHRHDLQTDGKLSLMGFTSYPDSYGWAYGVLFDQNLVGGSTYSVFVNKGATDYTFNATAPVNWYFIEGERKGIGYPLASYWSDYASTSGTIPVADDLPGIEKYWTGAERFEDISSTETVDNYWVAPRATLELALQANMPALSIGSVSYDDVSHLASWELLNSAGTDMQGAYVWFTAGASWDIWMSPAAARQWDLDRLQLPAEVEAWLGDRTVGVVQPWAERYRQLAGFDQLIQKTASGTLRLTGDYFFTSKGLYLGQRIAKRDSPGATMPGCRVLEGRPGPGRHRLLFPDEPRMFCPALKGAPVAGSERF